MKNLIAFIILNLSLLLFSSSGANAQNINWEITLYSGKKITNFSFGKLSEDSLSLNFSETSTKIAIDSIKEIRRVRESHVLIGVGIGTMVGTLLTVLLFPIQDSDSPTSEKPIEKALDDFGNAMATISKVGLGMVTGAIGGAIVGASLGKDEVLDFSHMTHSEKRNNIALIIKKEEYYQNKDKKN